MKNCGHQWLNTSMFWNPWIKCQPDSQSEALSESHTGVTGLEKEGQGRLVTLPSVKEEVSRLKGISQEAWMARETPRRRRGEGERNQVPTKGRFEAEWADQMNKWTPGKRQTNPQEPRLTLRFPYRWRQEFESRVKVLFMATSPKARKSISCSSASTPGLRVSGHGELSRLRN